LDLKNGAGREGKKRSKQYFCFVWAANKDPNLQIPIDESVCACMYACLVVLFLGAVNFSFLFLGTQAKTHVA
jgi:hypothetical protein